jgi:hypothetical protein
VVLALHLWRSAAHIGPWLDGSGDGLMERLQWWLLLLSAVMFSMSGCSSKQAWQGTALSDFDIWRQHSTHFASGHHMVFSTKSHPTTASITESDKAAAARQDWWGHLVPQEKIVVAAKPKPTKPEGPAPMVASNQAKDSWWRGEEADRRWRCSGGIRSRTDTGRSQQRHLGSLVWTLGRQRFVGRAP